jgi:hypothetical protein
VRPGRVRALPTRSAGEESDPPIAGAPSWPSGRRSSVGRREPAAEEVERRRLRGRPGPGIGVVAVLSLGVSQVRFSRTEGGALKMYLWITFACASTTVPPTSTIGLAPSVRCVSMGDARRTGVPG